MTQVQTEFLAAPIIGALPAGAAFSGTMALASNGMSFSQVWAPTADLFIYGPIMLFGVTIFGWLLAILPTLIGTVLMAQLGRFSELSRIPVVWIAAGIAPVLVAGWLIVGPDMADDPAILGAFAVAGGVCALVCRCYVSWHEATPAPAANRYRSEADPRLLH